MRLVHLRKLSVVLSLLVGGCQARPDPFSNPGADDRSFSPLWQSFQTQCWITYTPSTFDPTVTPMYWPTQAEVEADLRTLRAFGITGLVTYRANYNDRNDPSTLLNLPDLAQQEGFEGIILGIWDLDSTAEQEAVAVFQEHPLVQGIVAGNEGLGRRYTWDTLSRTIATLQTQTQKPVTTSEELRDYFLDDRLRQVGDWLFPNAHPYFGQVKEPLAAAQWTENWFKRLDALSDRPIVFKEVGLPTAGDPAVSEEAQAQYYQALAETPVNFVFFTAFDLPWKRSTGQSPLSSDLNPEPYWGLFHNDRSPKLGAEQLQTEQCLP
ncbi:MAG: hypothetical protein ACO31I_08505 [Prochlorotrichaceae cyanobacterium]